MDGKRLLITGDDFGMCHAINTGTVRAMTEGVMRSTTLMAPCPWFAEAVSLAKKHHLPCGVHFTLTCEWDYFRWRPLTAGLTLRDEHGYCPMTIERLHGAAESEVIEELTAQI